MFPCVFATALINAWINALLIEKWGGFAKMFICKLVSWRCDTVYKGVFTCDDALKTSIAWTHVSLVDVESSSTYVHA